ncbi:hypothetical protein SLA2020_183080 [Shorea laevis]
MELEGTMNRPYDDKLRAVSPRAQLAKAASTEKWLRDGSGNYVVEGARRGRTKPNMESSRVWDTRESHNEGKNRNWGAKGTRVRANSGGGSDRSNPLVFNVEDAIHNDSPELITSLKEGNMHKEITVITGNSMNGEIGDNARKSVERALERQNPQRVSNLTFTDTDNGPQADDTRQAHTLQSLGQNDQGKDMGSIFIFSSNPGVEGISTRTRTGKREERCQQVTNRATPSQTSRTKRKDESAGPTTVDMANTEKRSRSVGGLEQMKVLQI